MNQSCFPYPPSPAVLHWLSAGQLPNRVQRTMRWWVLLQAFYGRDWRILSDLPQPFRYPELRDRLFAPGHGRSDELTAQDLAAECRDASCICHKTLRDWLVQGSMGQSMPDWRQAMAQISGLSEADLEAQLQQCPFTTVHRSIRDDLRKLAELGWLRSRSGGYYHRLAPQSLPAPPAALQTAPRFSQLSLAQSWELLRALESIAFIQPHLDVVIQSLWEQVTDALPRSPLLEEPAQRIFLHFDYILPSEVQERVDTCQEQIEQLWRTAEGGVVQFHYWVKQKQRVKVIVYPVCLHYARRAKYLSAYGQDPEGHITWHNYRLDRIASDRLTVMAWGDPQVPKSLREMRHAGQLPQPTDVQAALDAAWGFNFYLPRQLLILRFPADFAAWYVDHTERHPTFQAIAHGKLSALIRRSIADPQEKQQVLELVKRRSRTDRYYYAWIRVSDINIIMRLRDWRPKGEVIAPLLVRQQMIAEAEAELANYRS